MFVTSSNQYLQKGATGNSHVVSKCSCTLFNDDDGIVSTKKSDFMQKLREKVSQHILASVEDVDRLLIDGLVVIQMLKPVTSNQTYRDMADLFWKYIISKSEEIQKVVVVFDSYLKRL